MASEPEQSLSVLRISARSFDSIRRVGVAGVLTTLTDCCLVL